MTQLEDFFEHIASDDIRIKGTRIGIETVIGDYLEGSSPEEIAVRYRALTFAQVYATILYYHIHQQDVEEYLHQCKEESERAYQEYLKNIPPATIRLKERLLAERAKRVSLVANS